jgi:hypothetical protein
MISRLQACSTAPAMVTNAGQASTPCPGSRTTSTPTNPAATALRRRQPTGSPRADAESAVTSSGEENRMAYASASGRRG